MEVTLSKPNATSRASTGSTRLDTNRSCISCGKLLTFAAKHLPAATCSYLQLPAVAAAAGVEVSASFIKSQFRVTTGCVLIILRRCNTVVFRLASAPVAN